MKKAFITILALMGVTYANVIFTPEEIMTSREDITYEVLQQANKKDLNDTLLEPAEVAATIMKREMETAIDSIPTNEYMEAKDFLEFIEWVVQDIKKDIQNGKPVWDTNYFMLVEVLRDHKNWFCE